MPELPEVETIRRELARAMLGERIKAVEVLSAQTIHNPLAAFKKQLIGNRFTAIDRRGKLLLLSFQRDLPRSSRDSGMVRGGQKLLIHLKMTGQLVYRHPPSRGSLPRLGKAGGEASDKVTFGGHNISESDLQVPNRFTRVAIHFADQSVLYFNDMRRFGFLKLVPDSEVEKLVAKSYGLDALDPKFSKKYLADVLKRRAKTSIKAALLDQKHLAGIGNIYADEVCFAVGIKPQRLVKTLTPAQIGAIHHHIKRILNFAIKHGGTTFTSRVLEGHYIRSDGGRGNFTNYLKVYGRDGEKCPRCRKGIIQKTRVAGRGTHFCPICQA